MPSPSRSEVFSPGQARKITCAACGLVNLDRFLSFPFCAACGARLPEIAAPRWLEVWKKPVPTFLWAMTVGSGILVLATLTFGIVLEKRVPTLKRLSVATQISPPLTLDSLLTVRLSPEPVEDVGKAPLRNVELRLNDQLHRNFELVSLTPPPQSRHTQGSGFYFFWPQLPTGQTLILRFKPKRVGRFPIRVAVYAEGYEGFEQRRTLTIGR